MAHAGKELTLGLVRAVGFVLRFAESLLDAGALRDVVRYAKHGLVRLRPGSRPKHIDQRPILPRITIHKVGNFSIEQKDLRHRLRHGPAFRTNQVEVGAPGQFHGGVAPDMFAGRAYADVAALAIDGADNVLGVIHDELVGMMGGFQRAFAFTERFLRVFPFGDILDHDEEMTRLPVHVPNEAGRARDPKNLAILADVAPLHRRTGATGEKLLRVLPALGNIVRERNVHGGALLQLLFGIAHHLAKRRIDLRETFVETYDPHSDGRFGKDLAETALACFEGGGPGGDGTHFPDATQTRNDKKNIFKDYPPSMFQRWQRTGSQDAID